jgi:hypothetical protein
VKPVLTPARQKQYTWNRSYILITVQPHLFLNNSALSDSLANNVSSLNLGKIPAQKKQKLLSDLIEIA